MATKDKEMIDEFEVWNHDVLKDVYNELKGFFGNVRPYIHFVRDVYVDTYAFGLLANESNLLRRTRPLEPYDENHDPGKYNEELLRIYNAITDIGERIRNDIIGGSNIFITNETIWNMGCFTTKKKRIDVN